MKHRALSMLLTLVMVVSLLPIAAVADTTEENTGTKEPIKKEDTVKWKPDDGPQVLFEDDNTTYYLGIAEENRLFGSDGGCDLSNDTDFCSFALVAQVFTLVGGDYKPVSDEVREKLSAKYNFGLQIHATESCVDHYYPELENDGVYRFTTKSLGDWIFEASATEKDNNQSVTYKARLTIALKRTQAEGVLGMSDGGDFVKELEFSEGEHNVMLAVGAERLRSRDVISANNEPADRKLTYGGAVKTIEYVGGPWWRITLEDSEEANSKGWIQYGEDENNCVNITVRPAPQPSGQLEVNYDGSYVRSLTLGAGTYDVELRLRDESNNSDWRLGEKYENRLSVDGTTVQSIEQDRFEDDEGHDVFMWKITVTAPESGSAGGWIKYGDGENASQVDIKVLAAHGDQVSDDDFIDAEVDNGELIIKMDGETYRSNVVKINWSVGSDKEYYLAACEWKRTLNDLTPKGNGNRGLAKGENDHMYISTRVFQLVSGAAGSEDASYLVREDIRQAMIDDGYEFKVVLHPIGGNENYPTSETVERDCLSSESEDVALEWEHIYYGDPTTAGWWAYEAQLVKKTGDGEVVVARSFSSEEYQNMQKDSLTLETNNVNEINDLIAAKLDEYESVPDDEIQAVEFFLPAGTIEGEIVIPETRCFVNLVGAGNKQGVISTTIKGGVELKGADCDLILIHFVGAGKDKETWGAETPNAGLSNAAVYGSGEGIPRYCILEGYYCAVSSEDRSSWAANHSVFLDNHIGIRMMGLDGGNLQMLDNWFVRNDIAVQVDKCPLAALENTHNCFVNNEYDLINDSGMTLWMSQNFFYHAAGSEASWEPVLWEKVTAENSDDVIGLRLKREGANGAILAEDMPVFEATENYNALGADGNPQYLNFLPRFDGSSKTMAYPLARTQECVSFFYPNWRDPNFCPQWWPDNDPYYPSYVQQGVTISEDELDGLRFSSYDSETDEAVGTFEFSASAAETEN